MYKLKVILYKCYQNTKLVILFFKYIIVSAQQHSRKLTGNKKVIVFTLEDDRLYRDGDGSGRYAYLILNLFNSVGYDVYLFKKINFKKYLQLGEYGRYMYSIKNLKIIDRLPERTENIIYAFDSAVKDVANRKWERLIYFNHLKPVSCLLGNMINIPYFMHPRMYQSKEYDRVKSYRNNVRKMRIFSGGNISLSWYENRKQLWKYNQLTRREGVRAIFKLGEDVQLRWNIEEFRQYLKQADYINRCIILKTDRALAININEWINIVAQSEFFLCLSGTDLPMCHNVIESMSVGTIPILSYQNWLFPALEHKKNAIVYSGKEDLVAKVKDVLMMTKEEILEIRANVLKYYDEYLSGKDFVKRFESNKGEINTIMLHPLWINNEAEEIEGQHIFNEIKKQLRGQPGLMTQ